MAKKKSASQKEVSAQAAAFRSHLLLAAAAVVVGLAFVVFPVYSFRSAEQPNLAHNAHVHAHYESGMAGQGWQTSQVAGGRPDPGLTATPRGTNEQLFAAIQGGASSSVAAMLEGDASIVHGAGVGGFTPLHIACQVGMAEIATLLIEHGADVTAIAQGKWTPLLLAAGHGHAEVVRVLCRHPAAIGQPAADGISALHLAAQFGRLSVAEALLSCGASASPRQRTAEGAAPLHTAAEHGQTAVATLLLSSGAFADERGGRSWTPLLLACQNRHADTAIALLDAGASVSVARSDGATPLHLAARYAPIDVSEALLRRGAAVDAPSVDLFTPLHFAAQGRKKEVATLLLDKGAYADARATQYGFTPLHIAAEANDLPMVRALLDGGATATATNIYNQSALDVARYFGLQDIAEQLAGAGVEEPPAVRVAWTLSKQVQHRGKLVKIKQLSVVPTPATQLTGGVDWVAAAIEVWRQHGVVVFPKLLPPSVLTPLKSRAAAALEGGAPFTDMSLIIRSSRARQFRALPIDDVASAIEAIAQRLEGFLAGALGESVSILECNLMATEPTAAEQSFHSDVRNLDPRLASVQIALTSTAASQGALDVQPGSHLNDDSMEATDAALPIAVPAGSVVFYSPRLTHRGRANTHSKERQFIGLTLLARGGVVPSGLPYAVEHRDVGRWWIEGGKLRSVGGQQDAQAA